MNRTGTILMAAVLVMALAAIPLGAAVTGSDIGAQNANVANDSNADANDSISPGEKLSGVIGVQNAEIDGEVSDRTFGIQIANAQTNESKADVVGDRIDEIEERLAEHEAELDALADARENGEITEGEYRAKVATVAAEKANTERAAEQANHTASELPKEILEDRGINVTAIQTLQERASELGGPETAEIAQSIAGENVGNPVAGDSAPGGPEDVPANGDSVDTDDAADGEDAAGDEPVETDDQTDQDDGAAENESVDDGGAEDEDTAGDDHVDEDTAEDEPVEDDEQTEQDDDTADSDQDL